MAPGRTNTLLIEQNAYPEMLAEMLSQVPMERLMQPREVAEAVMLLGSDAASGISGHTLVVDGAFLAK